MDDHIYINDELSIPVRDIELTAVRAQGAGGQNVNKVATAIHLRFDFAASAAIDADVCERLRALDDQRVRGDTIIIKAQEFRSQSRNRQAALDRLAELIRDALVEERERIPTRPTRASKKRRLADKRRKGELKRSRGRVADDD